MPFKSEKQRKYLWANEPKVAREWTDRYGAANGGIMDIASDGNTRHDFKNFKKGTSVNVPTSFQARSHSTPVNLAYITDDEAGILKALKPGTPHEGPMGIPNYDSFDADGNYTSGSAMSAMETGSRNARDRKEVQASNYGAPSAAGPGVKTKAEQDIRSSVINAGAGQRVNPGFFDSKTRLSPYELQLAKEFRNDPNNRFAKKAYRNTGQGGIMGFLRSGGLLGNLIRALGQRFGLGKKWDESTYDMSEFNNLGLGGVDPFANLDIRDKFDRRKTEEVESIYDDMIPGLDTTFTERDYGNPDNDPRIVSEEQGLTGYGTPMSDEMWSGGITELDTPMQYGGKIDKDTLEFIQPESWKTQEFPVREDFLPKMKKTSSIIQTGKPMINDEWEWYRW